MTGLRDHLGWRRIPDVVVGRLQQRSWTAEDGSARSVVEIVAEELGPSLRWATARVEKQTRGAAEWSAGPVSVGVGGSDEETPLDGG